MHFHSQHFPPFSPTFQRFSDAVTWVVPNQSQPIPSDPIRSDSRHAVCCRLPSHLVSCTLSVLFTWPANALYSPLFAQFDLLTLHTPVSSTSQIVHNSLDGKWHPQHNIILGFTFCISKFKFNTEFSSMAFPYPFLCFDFDFNFLDLSALASYKWLKCHLYKKY